MPDASAVAVAKAVVSMIDAATLSIARADFQLERSYADWELKLETMDELALREGDKLRIDVVSHTTEQAAELATRGGRVALRVPVDIAVRRKFGPDKQNDDTGRIAIAEIDGLVALVEELYLMFMPHRLTDFTAGVWDGENGGTKILVNPNRLHLRDLRQFTGLIRVMFRVDKST